jgi:hypothetical protein
MLLLSMPEDHIYLCCVPTHLKKICYEFIRLVINRYAKGYGFTNIRPYLKICHISRLYLDKISGNEFLST